MMAQSTGRSRDETMPPSAKAKRLNVFTAGNQNIPMMRRAKREQTMAVRKMPSREPANDDAPREVRWDPLTGERTTDAKGRPSQVNPVEYAQGFGLNQSGGSINSSAAALRRAAGAPASASFGDRWRKLTQAAKDEFKPSSRFERKAASGRTAVVNAVHQHGEDDHVDNKDDDDDNQDDNNDGKAAAVSSSSSAAPEPALWRSAVDAADNTVAFPSQLSPHSPIITSRVTSHGSQHNAPTYPSPPSSDNSVDADAPSLAAKKRASAIDTLPSQSPSLEPPPSRFGVSTHGADAQGTPPSSSDAHRQPAPTSPPTPPSQNQRKPTHALHSFFSKRQPVVNDHGKRPSAGPAVPPVHYDDDDDNEDSCTAPPPPPVSSFTPRAAAAPRDRRAAIHGLMTTKAVDRPASRASSINKLLPLAPPEASADEAQDRVALLNAQLSALGNRRINLIRSIKQMTELMPMDNLMASREVLLKRDMEKRKVAALKDELADIQREEYELGLKLHRAYKRMERDAVWEPTSLWVRRVAE